jgi:hypothetical protein
VAAEILSLAKVPDLTPEGPTDPEEIVRKLAWRRWEKLPDSTTDLVQSVTGRPAFEPFVESTWQELDSKLAEPDPSENGG